MVPDAADIAFFLKACPSFVDAVYPPERAAEHASWLAANQISEDEFAAELEKTLAEIAGADARRFEDNGAWSAPVKKRRIRGQPLREAAKRAIVILYGNRVPSYVILPHKKLVAEVCEYMIKHLQITTIKRYADGSYSAASTVLRAADRK